MKKYRNILIYCFTILFSIAFIFIGNKIATGHLKLQSSQNQGIDETIAATVTKILDTKTSSYEVGGSAPIKNKIIIFNAKITNGSQKGKIVKAYQTLD